jgi:hypothetical protein
MDLIKCSHCKFLGYAYGGRCKRCGQLITIQNSRNSHSSFVSRLPSTIKLLGAGAIFCGVIAGVVVVKAQLNKYFDPAPAYLAAISKSGKFEEPVTIRVNQKPVPMPRLLTGPFNSQRTVYWEKTTEVFQALGLLTISKNTSFTTTDLGSVIGPLEMKSERWEISLTAKGLEESANWRTTEEPYPMASEKALWWHVPIGSREITRIEVVNETVPNMVDVAIHWRWHPNKIGESFDCSGNVAGSLPKDAQDAVRSLAWNSQSEYTANARLRRAAGVWEVQYVGFPNEKTNDFGIFRPATGN